MKNIIGAVVALVVMAGGEAKAADLTPFFDDLRWSANFGTLGAGVEAGYRLDDKWGMRAGINGFKANFIWHDQDSDLHNRMTLLSAGLTADYYPYEGGFRVSAGARLSASKIDGKLRNLEGKVRKGGTTFQIFVADPLTDYTVRQNLIQPYLGLGYSVKVKERLSLDFDFGALYAGTPSLSVQSRAERFGFTHEQIRHEVEKARNRIEPYQVYPVVQVGLNFKF